MKLIKGKEIAENILAEIKEKIKAQTKKPCLAVILIGDDKASQVYVDLKEKASQKVGIEFRKILFDKNEKEGNIVEKIEELNSDRGVDGIIVQLPLPIGLNKEKIINTIDIKKDVDGFHQKNQNFFLENKESVFPVFPKAIARMVKFAVGNSDKKLKAVIVCKSDAFGIIMKKALEKMDIISDFIFCKDLKNNNAKDRYSHLMLERADVVITACGTACLIKNDMTKNDAIIIDGGITKVDGKILGDIDMDSFEKTNCKISPVPGGVGPVTVATLLENVYLSNKKSNS